MLLDDGLLAAPYAGALLAGAQSAAARHGVSLLLTRALPAAECLCCAFTVGGHAAVGVIYAADHRPVPPEVAASLERAGLPHVLLNTPGGGGRATSVLIDHRVAASLAVAELLATGHVRVGYVSGRAEGLVATERLAGFEHGMRAGGFFDPRLISSGHPTAVGGRAAAGALLSLPDSPTALVCFDDRMAIGIYQAAEDLARRIPEQLSVICLDDRGLTAADLRPALTAFALPYYAAGERAVEELAASTRGPVGDGRTLRLPGTLIRRQSAAPPT